MTSRVGTALIVALFLSAAVVGNVAGAPPPATPVLTGNYIFTWWEQCRRPDGGLAGVGQTTARVTFDATNGVATFNGFQPAGNPLTLEPIVGSATYSNTATTFTLDGDTFQAFYGDLKKGVPAYVSYIGVVTGDSGATCSDQAQLVQIP